MMSGLGFSNEAMPSFAPVRLDQPSTDVDFRSIAIELLQLTQHHMQQGQVLNAISTYRQACGALAAIQRKSEHDVSTIKSIETQISYLQSQSTAGCAAALDVESSATPVNPLLQQNEQVSAALISTMGMFAHRGPGAPDDVSLVQSQLAAHHLG